MRIISKFKDYYDSVQKYGQSGDTIYLRKTIRCVDKNKYTPPIIKYPHEDITLTEGVGRFKVLQNILDFCNDLPADNILKPSKWDKNHFPTPNNVYGVAPWLKHYIGNKEICYSIFRGLLFFCGEVHPVLMLNKFSRKEEDNYDLSNPIYIYDENQLDAFIISNDLQVSKENRDLIVCWLSEIKTITTDFLIANKIINLLIIKFSHFSRNYGVPSETIDLVINPCLDDLQFQKVYDANTTFQKLDSYICGTLTYPQNELIEVSNEQKIIKHGFDPKYGFRTRKENT